MSCFDNSNKINVERFCRKMFFSKFVLIEQQSCRKFARNAWSSFCLQEYRVSLLLVVLSKCMHQRSLFVGIAINWTPHLAADNLNFYANVLHDPFDKTFPHFLDFQEDFWSSSKWQQNRTVQSLKQRLFFQSDIFYIFIISKFWNSNRSLFRKAASVVGKCEFVCFDRSEGRKGMSTRIIALGIRPLPPFASIKCEIIGELGRRDQYAPVTLANWNQMLTSSRCTSHWALFRLSLISLLMP